MRDAVMMSIPADLAIEVLEWLSVAALPPYGAPTAEIAVLLACALARHNPPQNSACGPLGAALMSANDPAAQYGQVLEFRQDI